MQIAALIVLVLFTPGRWRPCAWAVATGQTQALHALAGRDDAPATTDFLRRVFPVGIVIGDYLYIDGGEVSHLNGGKPVNLTEQKPSNPMNYTLSAPLATSWTNKSVVFRKVARPKDAPFLNNEAAWRHPSGSSFYIWGGVTPYFAAPPSLELWKFTADGSGGGSWERTTALGNNVRANHGAWTQSRDVGYWMGGWASRQTDASISDSTYLAIPGLMALNLTSGELTNSSTTGLNTFGTLVGGAVHFVPFGPGGLLLFLGGGQTPILTKLDAWAAFPADFKNLTLYDLQSKKWIFQETSGHVPTPREKFCLVGVQGPNGTYEIFIYGGYPYQGKTATDEVYVLSLPGFFFVKAPQSPGATERAVHSCKLVGRRQLLSIGGGDGARFGYPESLLNPDQCSNGLCVFDLTRMAWSDSYDANADPYDSPAVVKKWYANGGMSSVIWSSPEVKAIFAADTLSTPGSENKDPSSPPSGSSTPPLGKIVGGIVGGLVGIAIVVGFYFWCWRRRRGPKKRQPVANTHIPPLPRMGTMEIDGYQGFRGR